MEKKKYTVFISSTFEDLQSERKKVIEALLSLDCFPVGMEYFNASDLSQWEVIKSLIDESDYYVLIIAGRYGSVDESSGLSYTQKEYEYARSKGVPVLSFIYGDMENLSQKKSEKDSENKCKLDNFIEEAKTRLCKYWITQDDLALNVITSLSTAIKSHPRTGWIRADIETSAEANKEIIRLRAENDLLQSKIKTIEESAPLGTESLAQGEDKYCVRFNYYDDDEEECISGHADFTWNQMFEYLAPYMVVECVEWQLENHFQQFVKDNADERFKEINHVHEKHFQDVKIQFMALGLIAESEKKKSSTNVQVYWSLTPYGHKVMMQLKAIKKE